MHICGINKNGIYNLICIVEIQTRHGNASTWLRPREGYAATHRATEDLHKEAKK